MDVCGLGRMEDIPFSSLAVLPRFAGAGNGEQQEHYATFVLRGHANQNARNATLQQTSQQVVERWGGMSQRLIPESSLMAK